MGSGPLSGTVWERRHHPDKREIPTPTQQFLLQPELGWTAEGESHSFLVFSIEGFFLGSFRWANAPLGCVWPHRCVCFSAAGEWQTQEVKQPAVQLQPEHGEQQYHTRTQSWVIRQWRQVIIPLDLHTPYANRSVCILMVKFFRQLK